ncbi:putative conserved membrane protein [Mycobacterium kansasii 732]|nr:putative conserved membrane protein [Mycobacterium kansasii 732]
MVFVLAVAGWAVDGYLGAAVALLAGVALVFVRWWGQPAWSWAVLRLRGRRPISWDAPITVANNRSGGGVRVQDGTAVVAVQLLGRAHRATTVTGSVTVETDNVLDISELLPMLRHPLNLELDSLSVITLGSRTGTVGDYPRVYDSEIGTPPYAGAARNMADHAVADHRQRAGVAVAQQRWGGGNFGCPAHRQLAALPRPAGPGGDRDGPGRAGSAARLGRDSRKRAAVEGHPRRIGLDDHIRLPARGDFVADPYPGMDPARR